ncbi:hypothetical protein [Aestuariicoccus sp. MJ-SS9]|uniref:hypothetical protein n=1 Tax=Aestuariicoccus sp. MJ-SS9 TaxID=3079855 RepID=UPI0029142FF6|nr:hypothetical protein [Aestuariicoccus sp. MJ-SS9]MDU8912168.1 hypothetical protein [Aestuariicoccus sp. MJ-SS9]
MPADVPAELFLIGDSNVIAIAQAADDRGLPWWGGPLAAGRMLEEPFWCIEGRRFVYTAEGAGPIRARFEDLLVFDGPVLTTLGFNSHRFTEDFARYARAQDLPATPEALSRAAFADTVRDARRVALEFYRMLGEHGREVWFTCSPQRTALGLYPLLHAFEEVLIPEVAATGARFIDTRDAVMDGASPRPEYANPHDAMHASPALGALVLDRLAARRAGRTAPV